MAQQPLTRDEAERTLAAVAAAKADPKCTGRAYGPDGFMEAAAAALGIHRGGLWNRIKPGGSVERALGAPAVSATDTADTPEARRETRDAAYWRRTATALREDLARTEHLLAEVSGLMARPVSIPRWIAAEGGDADRAVGLLHVSDVHAGEVVRSDEVGNLNAYDLEVCRRRLRRLFDAVIEVLPRLSADSSLKGVVVALNGDLVSGDIHAELRNENALTATEQVWFVTDEIAGGLARLAEAFRAVWVVCTPGNHGRTTEKPTAKRVAALSYDTMVGEALRRRFADDPRFTFHVSPGRDAVYPVLGWTVFQSHGDAMGTGGGRGFAGPLLPVLRGSKQVEWQAAQAKREYDVILTGHYHSSGSLGKTLANGSVVGYSEYANTIRASVEPPQQWLVLMHERWGVRERVSIQLEDPVAAPLPRVRVPMGMSTTSA